MRRAVATIKFSYDPGTYLFDWQDEEDMPSDDEIISRVKSMMMEDINTTDNDGDLYKFIDVEFVEVSDGDE